MDACLKEDKYSKVAVGKSYIYIYIHALLCSGSIHPVIANCILKIETAMKANSVMVLGEVTTKAKVDYVQVVKKTLETIGYEDEENGIANYFITMP